MSKKLEACTKGRIRFMRIKDLPQVELLQRTQITTTCPRHIHQVFGLSVGISGVGIHQTLKDNFPITPGCIAVVNIGEVHSGNIPDGHKYSSWCIRLDSALLHTLIFQLTGRNQDTVQLRQPVVYDPKLAREIIKLHDVLTGSYSKLEKDCHLVDVFGQLYRRHALTETKCTRSASQRIPVLLACEYLREYFSENVSLAKLAKVAGLSPFHLDRVFVKETGVSPHGYQLQIRLKKATDLLALGRPIVEVALETGFCDQSHFQRVFKKKFGVTPRHYESK